MKNAPLSHYPLAGGVLRGIFFERSTDPSSFYVSAVALPLYKPTDVLDLTFSFRLRQNDGGQLWDAEPDTLLLLNAAIESQGLRTLRTMQTSSDFALWLTKKVESSPDNLHLLEGLALTYVWEGEIESARPILDNIASMEFAQNSWQGEIRKQVILIRGLLNANLDEAADQLRSWQRESASALGLAISPEGTAD